MPDLEHDSTYEARPESWAWLIQALERHPVVTGVTKLDGNRAVVERDTRAPVSLFVCDIYMLGVADVDEILAIAPETAAIVNMSGWNRYSPQAKKYTGQLGIGLFRPGEFLGALYKEGASFVEHLSTEQRAALRRGHDPC